MTRLNSLFALAAIFSVNLLHAETKTGGIKFVSGQDIMSQLNESATIQDKLKLEEQRWTADLKKMQAEGQKLVQELELKRKTATKDAIEEHQEKLDKLQRTLQNKAKEAEETIKRAYQKELGKLNKKIQTTVNKMASKNGWDAVVLKETGEVLYTAPGSDASADIVTMMNREYTAKVPKFKK